MGVLYIWPSSLEGFSLEPCFLFLLPPTTSQRQWAVKMTILNRSIPCLLGCLLCGNIALAYLFPTLVTEPYL